MPSFFQRPLAALLAVCLACYGQEETPTFRATTTLIEFTFIALDRKGNPVTDLKKEEISVIEKGKPREVVFFRFEGETAETSPIEPLPPGVFSNRSEVTPGPPRNITAIVLDTLNTGPADQVWVRAQVMRYLRTMPRDTRMALYRLGTEMSILHDFTDDTDSLRARIDQITTALQTQSTGNIDQAARDAEQLLETLPPEQREDMEKVLTSQIETEMLYNESVRERRTKQSLASVAALGNHLAGIPGRKSVVWISGGISMLSITGAMGMGLRGGIRSYEKLVQNTSERLAHQGITLYLVDARGLLTPPDASAEVRGPVRVGGRAGPFERQQQASATSSDPLPAMYKMASVTGGRVVTNSNDPAEGMKQVTADSRGTYSVGFYALGEPDNKWHNLDVKVRRPGVKLLHRKGYLSEAVPEAAQNWSNEQWLSAIRNPLGSTALRIDARCDLAANSDARVVNVLLHVIAEDLHFRKMNDQLAAEFEVGFVEKTRTGEFDVRRSATGVSFPASNESHIRGGVVRYGLKAKLKPSTVTIRLVVRDRFTGRYGTLDLSVKDIPSAPPAQAQ